MGASLESTSKAQKNFHLSFVPSKGGAGAKVARCKEKPSILFVISLFHSQQFVHSG